MRESFKRGFGWTLGISMALLTVKIIKGLVNTVSKNDECEENEEDDILEDETIFSVEI